LSADGSLLAVGAPEFYENSLDPGYVRLYRWSASEAQQVGTDIVGEASNDQFGQSVALSADGSRLAVGAPSNKVGDSAARGHVRVFSLTPDLSLVGLELVQVVQNWNNSVNLVAGKATVARAHIQDFNSSLGSPLPTFRLRGYDNLGEGFFFPLEPPYIEPEPAGDGQSISFPPQISADSRSNKLQSLTFHLPESWVNAVVPKRFNLESVDGPDLACLEDGPESGNCEIWTTFSEQIPMTVHLIGSLFEQIGGPIYRTRLSDLKAVCSQIENRFPTHQVNCIYSPNPIVFPPSATMPEARDILWEAKTRKWKEACEWDECQDFYLVVTAFSACDEEACSDPTVLGDANFPHSEEALSRSAWAIDASQPSAAAHQLGHNFGLHHTTNTYLSYINPESNKGGNCGEKAARAARYPPGSNMEFFPYYLAAFDGTIPVLGPSAGFEELVYGYDMAANDVVPFLEKALMSDCSDTAWPDIDSYNYLFQQLSDVETVTPGFSPEDPVGAGTDTYFLVTGTLDRETDQATFRPIQVVTPRFTPNPAPDYLTTEWALLVNSPNTGNVFYGLHLMPLPSDPSLAEFTAWVPYDSGTNLFWVWQGGSTPAGEVLASWSLPVISLIPPAPGTIFSNYEITLAWNASDGDGDDLTFLVEYSPDGGQSWVNLSSKWPASPFFIHSEHLQASTNARFRVTAMDGFHSVTATMEGEFTVSHLGLIHEDGFE
jgi:hypothetical protein